MNWKEIACDWLFFFFLQTMVYQEEIRAFHQNLYTAPPFPPPFSSSSLNLSHSPSTGKRIFHFYFRSVFQLLMTTWDSPLLLFPCSPSPLPLACTPLGCVAWSCSCHVDDGGECKENSSVAVHVEMLTMLWNLLLPDLCGIFIWFHSFNLVFHSIRRDPKGLSNYQSHLFNFFPVLVWGEVEWG